MKHFVILFAVATLLFLSFFATTCVADLYPQTIFGVRPTVEQFKAEIVRADLVIRARVTEILFHRGGNHADEDVRVEVLKVYKGKPSSTCPCVRIEIYWHWAWDEVDTPRLPRVGDEVILPIEAIPARAGSLPPDGQDLHYMVPFYYSVGKDDRVSSIFDFPPPMRVHAATVEQFEALIAEALRRPHLPRRHCKLGAVLFTDDFDDGSLAGWTFLEGTKIRKRHKTGEFVWRDAVGYLWVGPDTVKDPKLEFHVTRDSKTGLFRGERHSTPVEFGVVNGRLRLRSHHYLHHITAVTGDPEWTDYQVDVDMWKFRELPHPSGPTDKEIRGEHSFVAVEIGNYANYDVSERTWGDSAFQIRCKYPEPVYLERDPSRILRYTQILDYIGFVVPEAMKMHLTARFTGRYVEGWIDGEKILEGEIPADHPGMGKGRIALWTFETFAEFDNLKVTQLVEVDE